MVKWLIRSFLWLFAPVMFGLLPVSGEAAEASWRDSYVTALGEAARTGRPLVLVVKSRGCGWCRELERTTLRDARVVRALNRSTVPLKVEADDRGLPDSLRVEALPTVAVIAPDGRILANRSGYLDAPSFLGLLRSVIPDDGSGSQRSGISGPATARGR